jgi:hypothetical protein
MASNRYDSANAEEKKNFTNFAKLIVLFLTMVGTKVTHRELKGEKSRKKYGFALKANSTLIHMVEFRAIGDQIKQIVLVISKVTSKSKFGNALLKLHPDAKFSYGGFCFTIPVDNQEDVPTLLEQIGKLAEASEELELDPKRTYSDPPQGWVDGLENPPVKKEKPVKAKAEVKEPVAEPVAEEVKEPTAEEVAQADIAAEAV